MRHALKLLACVVALSGLAVWVPSASAAASCQWHNSGEPSMYKSCTGIEHFRIAGWVTDGESQYSPPLGPFNPSASVQVRLKDKDADGSCVWLARRLTGTAWSYNYDPVWSTKVCGKGNSAIVGLRFEQQQLQEGGTIHVLLCTESYCSAFWKQAVIRKNLD